jgi:hypothetical protein
MPMPLLSRTMDLMLPVLMKSREPLESPGRQRRKAAARRPRGASAAICLTLLLGCAGASADTVPGTTADLHEALRLALRRLEGQMPPTGTEGELSNGVLRGPVMLAVSHLESDQAQGTDETEVSLTFPIKSPSQRDSDAALVKGDGALSAAQQRFRAWYLSGTLRELAASHGLAAVKLPIAEQRSALLTDATAQLQARVAAGSAERFDLLALQQAGLDAAETLRELRMQAQSAQAQFLSLTGLPAVPPLGIASTPLPAQPDYLNHPQLQLLQENYQRNLASLRSQAPASAPWNLSVVGREFSLPSFSERQLGLALELPLGLPGAQATATRSDLQALHRAYWAQRDQLLQTLRLDWQQTRATVAALRERQRALGSTLDEAALASLLKAAAMSRELPVEIKLARMQTLLEAAAEPRVTAARLAAAEASLRQLAGEPL